MFSLPMPAFITRLLLLTGIFALTITPTLADAAPKITHWQLDNGARVYFVASNALPILDIDVSFAAGSAFDPAAQAGLASLANGLLTHGANGLSEQQLSERIADSGARFGTSSDNDRATLTIRTLSDAAQRDAAIELAAQMLSQPDYDAAIIEREKSRLIAALRDARTRPAVIAQEAFDRALYGKHPYGASPDEESLNHIDRDALVAFHRQHYSAQNATISIVGQASRDEANAIAQRLSAALPAGERLHINAQPVAVDKGEHKRIANPSSQAHILVGMPVMSRSDADYFPLLVGNYIFGGGGFVSRLTDQVREKNGLAYSVYSRFEPRAVAGPFTISLQTRGRQSERALELVDAELKRFLAGGITAAELKAAQDNIIDGFGLRVDSNRKMLGYTAMIAFYGLPDDWLETYPEKVAAVSIADIESAFQRRLKPQQMSTIIVGGDGDQGEEEAATAAAPPTRP